MKAIRMTDRWVRTITVETGRDEFSDAVVRGLRLRITPVSRKWSVLTRTGGKQVRVPIGEFPEIGLADARERANRVLDATGVAATEASPSPTLDHVFPTLDALCTDYVEQMKKNGQVSSSARSCRRRRACDAQDRPHRRSRARQSGGLVAAEHA